MEYPNSSLLPANTTGEQLTPAIISSLKKKLSKTSIEVLMLLNSCKYKQQKDLCVDMHTSSSNLSNIMSRLLAVTPALIHVEKSGRSKYYSLTEIARAYIKQELLPEENAKIRAFTPSYSEDLLNDILRLLNSFKRQAGPAWAVALDNLLCGNFSDTDPNLNQLYEDFIDALSRLRAQQRESSLEKVYDALHENILVNRIQKILETTLERFYLMEPLFTVEQQDTRAAFGIIDKIFSELYPTFYSFDSSSNIPALSPKQYHSVFYAIATMKDDLPQNNYSKAETEEYWSSVYYTSNASLSYIAEKYKMLYMLQKSL